MAKRKKGWKPVPTRATIIPDPPHGEDELDAPEALSLEDVPQEIEELLADLPQETVVKVARWDEKVGDFKHAGVFPVQGFSLDVLAKQRGAGKFRLRIWGPKVDPDTGKSHMHEYARRIENIDESLAPVPVEVPRSGTDAIGVQAMLLQMMDMNMKTMNVMLNAIGQREKASEIVSQVAQLMKPAGDAKHDRLFEILLLRMMKEKGGGFDDMLAVLEKGMELAKGGDPDPLATAGIELVKLVSRGLDQQAAARALPPGQPSPVATAGSGTVVPGAPPMRELPPEQVALIGALQSLVDEVGPIFARVSKSGLANVDTYAGVLADEVDRRPALDESLEQWFADPEYPGMVVPLFPEVDATWLTAVLLRARDLLLEDEDADQTGAVDDGDGPAPPGGSGDGANAGGDAPVRERGAGGTGHPKSSRTARPRLRPVS